MQSQKHYISNYKQEYENNEHYYGQHYLSSHM